MSTSVPCEFCGKESEGTLVTQGPQKIRACQDCVSERFVKAEVRDMPVACDFCATGFPEWTFRCKPGTVMLATRDNETGETNVIRSSGYVGACLGCHKIILGPMAPQRLARRVVSQATPIKTLTQPQRKRVRTSLTKNYQRLLPLLHTPRPYCPNEDPLEARGIFFDLAQ